MVASCSSPAPSMLWSLVLFSLSQEGTAAALNTYKGRGQATDVDSDHCTV